MTTVNTVGPLGVEPTLTSHPFDEMVDASESKTLAGETLQLRLSARTDIRFHIVSLTDRSA